MSKHSDAWKKKAHQEKRCITCGKDNPRFPLTLCGPCNEKKAKAVKARLREDKIETFQAYGGVRCACSGCAVDVLEFLGLDHIYNNGNQELYSGHHLYRKLKEWGYPPGFQVLCHNCNLGRHLNGGICPHVSA